ncbi:alpha/beta hydrolase [Nocardioides convexus]|uniref:alpha/beta hydrolase n=1 Tax=Nocardioides convexus TaxID=2712224 RepID=UPI00241896FB|nr:alpha/beta hydrolase [Nocardioides convexus]
MTAVRVDIPSPRGGPIRARVVDAGARLWVLSHGIFVDKSENGRFERLAPLLEGAGISSAAFDLPGHGQSATPSSEANVEAMVWSLVDVLRWARGRSESVGLVSSSFSGAVTSLAWPLIRDLVNDQLVMINPVLRFDDTFVKPTQPEMAAMFNDSTFEQASRLGSLPTGPAFRNESGNVARIPSHGRCASLRTDRPSSLDLPRRCGRVDPV